MKKLLSSLGLIMFAILFSFSSCEDKPEPPDPPGTDPNPTSKPVLESKSMVSKGTYFEVELVVTCPSDTELDTVTIVYFSGDTEQNVAARFDKESTQKWKVTSRTSRTDNEKQGIIVTMTASNGETVTETVNAPQVMGEVEVTLINGYSILGFEPTEDMDTIRWTPEWSYAQVSVGADGTPKIGDPIYVSLGKNLEGKAYDMDDIKRIANAGKHDELFPRLNFLSYISVTEIKDAHKDNPQLKAFYNYRLAWTSNGLLSGDLEIFADGADGGAATTLRISSFNASTMEISGELNAKFYDFSEITEKMVGPEGCSKSKLTVKFSNLKLDPQTNPYWLDYWSKGTENPEEVK